MSRIILLIVTLIASITAYSQTDTTFWFAAPDISSDYNYDRPVMLRITCYSQPSIVTVSQPANGGMPPQTISLTPNTTQSIDLTSWLTSIECGPGNIIQNKGLKISSTNEISAYYEVNVNGPNPELFALKGRNALGNQFYISSQYLLRNSSTYNPKPYSSFNIVASEDNSLVTITPTQNITGHSANIPFTITLNKGQTYAAIAASQLASGHLQGSSVISTKPVAITLSDDLLDGAQYGGICADMAGDQTVPVNITGNEYIALKSNLSSPFDKLYITATQNATTITQDGIVVATINAGQSIELTIVNSVTYVQTSLPAYAYQLSGYNCEVGSAILPKINCTGSSAVSVTRSTNETFIVTLLIKNGGQNSFLVNGVAGVITSGNFNVVPGTGGLWYYAKVTLSPSTYPNGTVIRITNSVDLFQQGVLQGDISGVSFGYFSDYNSIKANTSTTTPNPCGGSDIQLTAETVASTNYNWTGPNGFTSNSQNVSIPNVAVINSGDYILSLTVPGCGVYMDTVTVIVKPKSFSNFNQVICQGQSFGGYSNSGTYIDTLIAANGCDSIRTINLTLNPRSFSALTASICQGQNYLGHSTGGVYLDTLIAANGCDSIRTLNLTIIPGKITSVNVSICQGQSYFAGGTNQTVTGIYKDTFFIQTGCDSILITSLLVNPKPNPDLGPDKGLCTGISVALNPGAFKTYTWQNFSTLPIYTVNNMGKYWVTVTDNNNCSNTDTILINNIFPPPSNFLNPIDSICQYETMTIFPLNSYPNYLWSTGSVQPHITIGNTGQYILTVQDLNNCTGKDSIQIFQKKCSSGVFIPTAFTPNNDQINNIFRAKVYGTIISFRLDVYNRYGEIVFSSTNYQNGWNGNFKGFQQNSGVFVWQCSYQLQGSTPTFKKGTVTLIR